MKNNERQFRGGSWFYDARDCKYTHDWNTTRYRTIRLGFRVIERRKP